MTREEHLQWCKDRALEYVDNGNIDEAIISMLSDLNKHEETRDHPASQLMFMLKLGGHLETSESVRKFINGFN